MTKFIIVASAKGGVGKTTTAVNLGIALSRAGKDVIVIDGNLTSPHVALHLGVSNLPTTLHDALEGKISILNAVYRHESGLKVIPGDLSINSLSKLNSGNLKKLFKSLQGASEFVIIDSAAGLTKDNLSMMEFADNILVVTTPDIVSVSDSLKTIKLAERKNVPVLGVVLNRAREDDFELSASNVESIVGYPVIATIPESEEIRKAQSFSHPVAYNYPNSDASNEFRKLAARLSGLEYKNGLNTEKTGWFDNIAERFWLR